MKGFGKAIARTPFAVTSRMGMAKKSSDPEFEEWNRQFIAMENAADRLLKDTKAFVEATNNLFTAAAGFGARFAAIFQPIGGEHDLHVNHPNSARTIRDVSTYERSTEELKTSVAPELELIESRIIGPIKELQNIMKLMRKTITKRDHKLVDYDRFNNSLTKLRDKKEKSLNDEKNLFKLEQDFENAMNDYEYINNALKTDLPRFTQLAYQFIIPLFNSFFYMQLQIYWLILEKMNGFADEGKYNMADISGTQIQSDFENKRSDALQRVESLNITRRIISVSKLVQENRSVQNKSGLGRAASSASASSSSFKKPPPPPPPSLGSQTSRAPPPPYSASFHNSPNGATTGAVGAAKRAFSTSSSHTANDSAVLSVAATKRAPPPPPPLKTKPKVRPQPQYVVALYDFTAQTAGDLSFKTGDRIEIVERSASAEDWWTGRLNGVQGVFPGNYVQDT